MSNVHTDDGSEAPIYRPQPQPSVVVRDLSGAIVYDLSGAPIYRPQPQPSVVVRDLSGSVVRDLSGAVVRER